MDSSLLKKYTSRPGEVDLIDRAATDVDPIDDLGCFGWLRGIRDAARMLELRKRNGNILAVGYAWLEQVEFDPSHGITLHLAGQEIRITGRNLNTYVRPSIRLFEGLTRHRIPWAAETSRISEFRADLRDATVIEAIEW